MKTQQIRETFLNYFEEKDHFLIGGSSVVPKNDPTLLLINSGMAPLKPYFTGAVNPPSPRLCNVQKCVRTNDIDDVGDPHHLTFFEMLGSWSIGDYFKERSIDLAAELLMGRFGIPQDKLYVTVYSGNAEKGVPYDQVSHDHWASLGFKPNQIVPLGDEDNFWGPAGDTGPCGPCTEVFIDMGPEAGPSYEETGYFNTKKRYIEIWNASVFMQFNKGPDGSLSPLPFTSVDTGSGLERMAIPMNGYKSVYEGEPYRQIIDLLPQAMAEKDKRVIADHTRASIHLIGDGVLPGKNGREYITRRLVRRIETAALRNGIDAPYGAAFDEIIKAEGQNHPCLISARQSIEGAISAEANVFKKVLQNGSRALDKATRGQSDGSIPGKTAFNIVSSHGLPLDTLVELAGQRGLSVDQAEYRTLMEAHKNLSRTLQTPK